MDQPNHSNVYSLDKDFKNIVDELHHASIKVYLIRTATVEERNLLSQNPREFLRGKGLFLVRRSRFYNRIFAETLTILGDKRTCFF
jgi:hypothetical protein